jgi:hypothetical protein
MEIQWRKYNLKNKEIEALVTILSPKDRRKLKKLYKIWKKLNDKLKTISTRGINFPEAISENAFCIFFPNYVRVVKLKKGKCSYDCINTKTGERVQIKASSITSDLTSFGPKSEWDSLFFLNFSKGDGSFRVYKIEKDWVYNHKVNKNQTFKQQQEQSRRPRFSITENIIKPRKLRPIKICKL